MNCCVCGKDAKHIFEEELYCKKHYNEIPRSKCKANAKSGSRCNANIVGGYDLCVQHREAGAKVVEWETCEVCGRDKPVGEECPMKLRRAKLGLHHDGSPADDD